jgi:hypothetical protein
VVGLATVSACKTAPPTVPGGFRERRSMIFIFKFGAVASGSAVLCVLLGLPPSMVHDILSAQAAQRPNHGFRLKYHDLDMEFPEPNWLTVTSKIEVGDPEKNDETMTHYMFIGDYQGKLIAFKCLGSAVVKAGEHSRTFNFHEEFELQSGTYRVTLLSAYPNYRFRNTDVSIEPGVRGWSSARVTVK